MNKDRLCQILLAPRVTEKTTLIGENSNQYVFHVVSDASKSEVKGAVEQLFEVNVESVRIVNVKGKNKSFRMRPGKRSDWKKAYVRVQEGQVIDFLGGESV
ncbi:MAG: 50S ribosomal protein L23 [Xanthomonadales bacterium]